MHFLLVVLIIIMHYTSIRYSHVSQYSWLCWIVPVICFMLIWPHINFLISHTSHLSQNHKILVPFYLNWKWYLITWLVISYKFTIATLPQSPIKYDPVLIKINSYWGQEHSVQGARGHVPQALGGVYWGSTATGNQINALTLKMYFTYINILH